MINTLFEESDIYNEDEDEKEYEELNIEKESVDEVLNIEQVIDLGSKNDNDWNLEEIV
ncbi:hypothetical protein C1646_775753 [Rhizophagus diaphanus]|nr:hypothetical protein C1646_775753 [Rhizophagus diaphanus] [Rhizophagus sp. MUCL 43196]